MMLTDTECRQGHRNSLHQLLRAGIIVHEYECKVDTINMVLSLLAYNQ